MIIHNVQQWTEKWLSLRKGMLTGTKLKAIKWAPTTATYKTQLLELVTEELWPITPIFQNDAMIRWTMLEPIAREEYEKLTNQVVDELGFCVHDTRKYLGLSPDWFIKDITGEYTKAIEIKCLGTKNHLKAIIEWKIPKGYEPQVENYFLVNEKLEELDFVMFNPDVYLPHLKMYIINIKRADIQKNLDARWPKLDEFAKLWEETINLLTNDKKETKNIKENTKTNTKTK